MRTHLPRMACTCFSTCTLAQTNSFLSRMPEYVTSRESPWHDYLSAVYTHDVPLPFKLSGLRFFYHSDVHWLRAHPEVRWPMADCPTWNTPSGLGGMMRYEDPMNYSSKEIGFARDYRRTRRCSAAECSRWVSAEPQRSLGSSEHVVQLFALPNGNGTTRGTVFLSKTMDTAAVGITPSNAFAEVIRVQVRNKPGPTGSGFEGMNNNGCWLFYARGSGIWINTGAHVSQ